MRIFAMMMVAMIATPAVGQDTFATREGCLSELQSALRSAEVWRNMRPIIAEDLASAPESAQLHADNALEAFERQAQATIDYADALLLLCQSYDQ